MAGETSAQPLDYALIGNGRIAALVVKHARLVWWCFPRFDGDPVFSRLLTGEEEKGFADVLIDGHARTEASYVRNTAIVETRLLDASGNGVRITDFAPRFLRFVSDPPVPYDPQDPQNQRTYPLCVCLKAQPLPLVGEALHEAKLCRSVLEHERRHEELFQDGEIERPYVFVTVFPDEAIGNDALPVPDESVVRPRFTYPFNFSNSPTLTLPCGFTADGVPIALQLAGPHFSEATLLRAGHEFEQSTAWHTRVPL